MKLMDLYRAIVHDEKTPPKGVITSEVSAALQEHEVAVARLNKVACDILQGEDCHCCDMNKGTQH